MGVLLLELFASHHQRKDVDSNCPWHYHYS
jgi:hypothetical protein